MTRSMPTHAGRRTPSRPGPTRLVRLALVALVASAALPAGAGPLTDAPAGRPTPGPSHERVDGVVRQRLDAGGYTYLHVQPTRGTAPVWVVTLGAGHPVGARIRATAFGEQRQFVSRRLGRTFDRLLFAAVALLPTP